MEHRENNEQSLIRAEVFENLTDAQIQDICRLYAQFSLDGETIISDNVLKVLQAPGVKIVGLKEGDRILGITLLFLNQELKYFYVELEDVMLDEEYRGRGLGERLVRFAVEEAKRLGADKVVLSSVPARVEAGNLYEKIGFNRYETRNYELSVRSDFEDEKF